MPAVHADFIGRLDAQRCTQKVELGKPGSVYIGHLAINPTGGGMAPRDQARPPEQRRVRGKAMASIPELPWKRQESLN